MSEHTPLTDEERDSLILAVLDPEDDCAHNMVPVYEAVEHILAARTSTATADTGLRERVEALAEQLAAAEIADLRDHHAAEVFALLDATPASTEDRADNEGTR